LFWSGEEALDGLHGSVVVLDVTPVVKVPYPSYRGPNRLSLTEADRDNGEGFGGAAKGL
jgi:hypothetical protein